MLSISLGVAALVAVRSFRADVSRSIEREAQVLLGADVRMSSRQPLRDSIRQVVDSLEAAGHQRARMVTAASMVLAPASGNVRLLQVRAVEGGWPFYGAVVTTPEHRWGALQRDEALVDPAVVTQLGVGVGDTIRIGESRFLVAGTVRDLPTDLGFQTAVAPRVFIPLEALASTGIIGFGSIARYETFLTIPDAEDRARLEERHEDTFRAAQVVVQTAEEQADDLTEAVGFLGRYLGLVGLAALLLGGIGVGSAIHVFVKERLTEVAVLRCIGARQGSVFSAYLLQAGGLGLLGALLGAGIGVGLQQTLPVLLASALPVQVDPRLSWVTVAWGVGMGMWVALIFALLPLLTIRDVPPLRALRHGLEPTRSALDPLRVGAVGLAGLTVTLLAVLEAPSPGEGLAFAGALAVTAALLAGVGKGLAGVARRLNLQRAPYPLRQGVSNLFRPRNQTISVTLALGFGAFVVGTVLLIRSNLTRELSIQATEGQPNLLVFDIQSDQRDGVVDLLSPAVRSRAEVTSLVPARLTAINGVTRGEFSSLPREERPAGWAVRRDYRHTFRWELTEAEILVAGEWWDDAREVEPGVARISMESELADDLKVGLGDRISWDVSGVRVESEIVSLREVDWSRFQTNFFVVFEPGSLDAAPSTYVILTRMEGEEARALFQRDLVNRYSNVSVLDLTRVQETVDAILARVTQAIAFLALFAALAGVLVLGGALASSRHQRLQEGALLRTLGARRPQILAVIFAEYLALGVLATLAGLVLALAASGFLVSLGFQIPFIPDYRVLLGIWAGVSALTLATGLLGSQELLRKPPLPVLRGE
jgi:putative ABC transport system permease protein